MSHQSVKTYMYRYVIVATAGWYQAVSVLVDGKAKINNQIPFSEFKSKIIILGLGKLNAHLRKAGMPGDRVQNRHSLHMYRNKIKRRRPQVRIVFGVYDPNASFKIA